MPEACRHFNQPAEILCLTSSSMSPSFCSTNPKYRKVVFWTTTCPSRLTSPPLMPSRAEIAHHVLGLGPTKSEPFRLSRTKTSSLRGGKKYLHYCLCLVLIIGFQNSMAVPISFYWQAPY